MPETTIPPSTPTPRSALPWSVGEHPGGNWGTDWRELLTPTVFGPAFVGHAMLADANFIITAVNHHTGLLQSLQDLEIILSGKPYDRDEQQLLVTARAAIAKAKGAQCP